MVIDRKPVLGIIGGSGLYNLEGVSNIKKTKVKTPFGLPSDTILSAKFKNISLNFLPRHGKYHNIAPHKINYRANIYALKKLGVTDIVSVSAVGSLKKKLRPGNFVLVDQFVDRTVGRKNTFFENSCVAHVSLANPVSNQLVDLIYKSCPNNLKIKKGGTYIAIEGPQFSSYAESLLYKSWNCDVIGMTNMPEARLAREAEMGYSTIAMVTDYDCWHEDHESVTVGEIISTMNKNTKNVKQLLKSIFEKLENLKKWNWNDASYSCLKAAIITNINNVSKEDKKKLSLFLDKK